MLVCRLAQLERPPRRLQIVQSVSRLDQGQCSTGCRTRLTRVPAGEDDGLDESDGQKDCRRACEAPVQRRLEKVLIRSPPDWSHLRCQAALSEGKGETDVVGGWQRKAWLRPKMEEAAPRQPSLVNKSSAKKQAARFAGVHPCKHSHRGAEVCTASTVAKTLTHTHHPHHTHHTQHPHHPHQPHHSTTYTTHFFLFFLLFFPLFSSFYIFHYYLIYYLFIYLLFISFFFYFFKRNFFFNFFFICFIFIKKGNGLLKGVVEVGVTVSKKSKMRVCNSCCCGPCTYRWLGPTDSTV